MQGNLKCHLVEHRVPALRPEKVAHPPKSPLLPPEPVEKLNPTTTKYRNISNTISSPSTTSKTKWPKIGSNNRHRWWKKARHPRPRLGSEKKRYCASSSCDVCVSVLALNGNVYFSSLDWRAVCTEESLALKIDCATSRLRERMI